MLAACHSASPPRPLQDLSDTARSAWALFGISEDVVSGQLRILEDYGDYLQIRIGRQDLAIGDTNVVVPDREFARIRQLRGRSVVAGTWMSTLNGTQKQHVTVDDSAVCIGEGSDWEVPAAELRRLNGDASWNEEARGMERGDWRDFVGRCWKADNADVISNEVAGMLSAKDQIGLARDITGWYARVVGDVFHDIPPIEVRLNRLYPRSPVASLRGLAIKVIGQALGVSYMRWRPEMSDAVIARRLWTTVVMLQHIDVPYRK